MASDEDKLDPIDTMGKVEPRVLEEEIQQSYLSYAMSVIVARALPDVRDGLKPVHRRVLYAMGEMGLRPSAKYRKSATVVGEVLGKYHPHGDVAAYDTMVRMAQDFAMRYPLVDGQGNFGSVDGDGPAAMRYTEAKMTKIAEEMLADIDRDTVDFMDNYDGTRQEPKVLPAKVPQLLLNGTVGIAVGMATSIPPHNLSELIDAVTLLIDNPGASLEELMEYIQGPDFPTGGTIYNPKEIKEAYATGKGRIVTRAVAEIEETSRGFRILVTEIPYQVNKAALIEKIAELVKNKRIVGVSDLRDESDKSGVRIVIELKKDSYPKKVLNQLFKLTAMQSVFYVNVLALVEGIQPQVLTLKSALEHFIEHRRRVVTRRAEYELIKAQERAHILEGLKIALENLDAVIKTIKQSRTKEDAHANLMKKFKLTEAQATAILEMRLSALAGLERQKVEDEHKEKQALIKELTGILADAKKIMAIIKKESLELKERYGDERRTKVAKRTLGEFSEEDLVPNEEVVITITKGGYIKRQPVTAYRAQKRGGKGVIGMTTKEEDQIEKIQVAKNHDDILFFTNRGRVFRQRVYEVPQASRIAKGTAVVNLIQLAPEEIVTGTLTMPTYAPGDTFVMITKRGVIKKTEVEKYANIRTSGLIAIKLDEGDELKWIRQSRKGDTVVIITRSGQAIHFSELDARLLGRSTRGVRGIRLRTGDEVVGADVASPEAEYGALVVAEKGLGKRTSLTQYALQKRGGIGIKTMNITERTGKVVGGRLVEKGLDADFIITSKHGQVIRLPLNNVPMLGRSTQGVTLMRLKSGDKVASFSVLAKDEGEEEITAAPQKLPPPVESPPRPEDEDRFMLKQPSSRSLVAKPAVRPLIRAKPKTEAKPVVKTSGFMRRKLAAPVGGRSQSHTVAKKRAATLGRFTRRRVLGGPSRSTPKKGSKSRLSKRISNRRRRR
ncbi:DNA gyrase subunit A [candidate division Kazan bacterium RBG_13_50_9]|uniref:DNA gyrase subunit A n=1 Tax=candidate division Kazan bacterium RBG_13_50_9 TaxID=1798535 RepID=A0A1F4NRN1_UNCK3|nr:MAG: DNA gyrase subunit A [candidate division Kazan bacterium RBG_13_50_9]